MAKRLKVWIYEYKDDDTPTGATFIDGFVDDIMNGIPIQLPHLSGDWHWCIDFSWEYAEEKCNGNG